jgi:hypothetical protein
MSVDPKQRVPGFRARALPREMLLSVLAQLQLPTPPYASPSLAVSASDGQEEVPTERGDISPGLLLALGSTCPLFSAHIGGHLSRPEFLWLHPVLVGGLARTGQIL